MLILAPQHSLPRHFHDATSLALCLWSWRVSTSPPVMSPAEPRTPPLIPPHIGWPLLVVLLLLMSLAAGATTVYFAMSDGGVQLVEDAP